MTMSAVAIPKSEADIKKWLGTFLSGKSQGVRASSLQTIFKDQFSVAIDYNSLGYRKLSLALTAWSDVVQCQFDVDRDLIIYPAGIPLPSPDKPSNPISSSRKPTSSQSAEFKKPFQSQTSPHGPFNSATNWRGGAQLYPGVGPWYAGMQGAGWNGYGTGPHDWHGGGYPPGRTEMSRWPRQEQASRSSVRVCCCQMALNRRKLADFQLFGIQSSDGR